MFSAGFEILFDDSLGSLDRHPTGTHLMAMTSWLWTSILWTACGMLCHLYLSKYIWKVSLLYLSSFSGSTSKVLARMLRVIQHL